MVRDVQGTVYYGFMAPVALYGALAAVIRRNRQKDAEAQDQGKGAPTADNDNGAGEKGGTR